MKIFISNGWAQSIVPAGLVLAFTFAQAQTQIDTKKRLRADPASAEAPVEAVSYRSAFTSYRSLRNEPVAAWKSSNDLTAKIGGWRVYGKEDRQPPDIPPAATSTKDHTGHHGGQQ